ncbi:MAG TPA: hypothetical protein VEK57_10725 [Thermoanaerobaculia bacterium]|nr:hypothetical protein [Thermoanaerobaculia bacterium]
MPDWSYRTILRPLMLAMGAERSRRLAVRTLGRLARVPFGPAAIDFLGHMRADGKLRMRFGARELPGPIALGALIDPRGECVNAFARFGAGLIEVGPVAERGTEVVPDWRVDLGGRTITSAATTVVGVDELEANLKRAAVPVAVRIAERDPAAVRRIVRRLQDYAAVFVVETAEQLAAAEGTRPVLLAVNADGPCAPSRVSGVWIRGELARVEACVRAFRAEDPEMLIIAAGVVEPEDARGLLDAGANVAAVDAGLVISGPGLIKRCNEALLSTLPHEEEPEPFSLEAARRAWFWALFLGIGMFAGGLLAIVIASTRVVLPYDESLCGMTRGQLAALNPRLLPFMAHDRVSLAGTMLSIGIFYAALGWFGVRRGAHWAHVTVIVSSAVGFFSFFSFLGFGYFDPFHAFVTAILTQFTLLCMVLPRSAPLPPQPEWRESAAWRRGLWGQLLFIFLGVGLTGAGLVMTLIACTWVFVDTDLAYMRTTAAQLRLSYERLVPLVAHDRASLGGMLIANGITVWLSAQWGFRAGARWLWLALAWGGNIAFASAVAVHVVVGYGAPLHLLPAFAGWVLWNVALALSREWLAETRNDSATMPVEIPQTLSVAGGPFSVNPRPGETAQTTDN